MLGISKLKSKKGVSPLIATILLIAFAVALGSVVMNWSLNLGSDKSKDDCRNVEIKIRSVNSAEICSGSLGQNGYINFIIENKGVADINGLVMWIIGDKGTKLVDLDGALIKSGTLYNKNDKEITYDSFLLGMIKQVQFMPKIQIEQKTENCPKNSVKAEKVGICVS